MKKLLNELGIHKMDEMEKVHSFKSQRNAFVYVILVLLCWSFYESYQVYANHTSLNPFPSFLLSSTVIIQILSQQYYQHQVVKGDAEYHASKVFIKYLVLFSLVVVILLILGTTLLFSF